MLCISVSLWHCTAVTQLTKREGKASHTLKEGSVSDTRWDGLKKPGQEMAKTVLYRDSVSMHGYMYLAHKSRILKTINK